MTNLEIDREEDRKARERIGENILMKIPNKTPKPISIKLPSTMIMGIRTIYNRRKTNRLQKNLSEG